MTDEEYEALKKKLYEEEQRREAIRKVKEDLSVMNKRFGLTFPNGWVSNLKTTVHQTYIWTPSADGNGPSISEEDHTIEISERDMKLLGSVMNVLSAKIKDVLKEAEEKNYSYEEIMDTIYYSK